MTGPRYADGVPYRPAQGDGEVVRFEGSLDPDGAGWKALGTGAAGGEADGGEAGQDFERGWEQRLRLAWGVGPRREARLKERGYGTLGQLVAHPVHGPRACEAMQRLRSRDVTALRRRGMRDRELVSLFRPGEVAFFDIETLGLAPVFPVVLAGFAWQENGQWRYLQLLAPHLESEPALLWAMEEVASRRFAALVTYNGRGFDLPFLSARRAYHGLDGRGGWPPAACLDLLGDVRRLLRPVLGSARLGAVESALGGGFRRGGIGSDEVPIYYERFVQTGDPSFIDPVLIHNYQDLRALVGIWQMLSRWAGSGDG